MESLRSERLRRAARNAVRECLGVKAGETLVIVTDPPMARLARLFFEEGAEAGAKAVWIEMPVGRRDGEEPPGPVAAALAAADAALAPTSRSISHTQARRAASAAGARIATLPQLTEEVMSRALLADYTSVRVRTERLAELLARVGEYRIASPAGTDLYLKAQGRPVFADTGILREPGAFGNLPAGEVFLAPLEGTAEGLLVVDGSMAGVGALDEPIRMTVRAGMVTEIDGGADARRLAELLEEAPEAARCVAELGIGTNETAEVTGNVLEDEKVLGTVHVAIGDNVSMGGNNRVDSHLDGVLLKPSLWADGQILIDEGRPVWEGR